MSDEEEFEIVTLRMMIRNMKDKSKPWKIPFPEYFKQRDLEDLRQHKYLL